MTNNRPTEQPREYRAFQIFQSIAGLGRIANLEYGNYTGDDKQPEEQFQLFWLCTNLVLAAVLGTLVLFQPTYLPMFTPNHLLHSKMTAALVLATIIATGLASFNMFFILYIKSGLESGMMDKPYAKEQKKIHVSILKS